MKKRRLLQIGLVFAALLGAALAIVVYVAPERAREAWHSLQGRLTASSSAPADPSTLAESAVGPAQGPRDGARMEPRLETSATAGGGKPVVPAASGRKLIAAKPSTQIARASRVAAKTTAQSKQGATAALTNEPSAAGALAAATKSAVATPGPTRAETTKPDATKPEATKPEAIKAGAIKPEATTKAAASSSASTAKEKDAPGKQPAPTAVVLAAAIFEFPADEAGRLLADKLTPPRETPLAHLPFVREPRPRLPGMPDNLAPHVAKLPPAVSGAPTVVVGDERRSAQRQQPSLDRPPLAVEMDPERPQRPLWAAAPLAYSPSANPDVAPALRYVGVPLADAVTPQDDPTADSSRTALLAGAKAPMPVPPPPLRLAIPDPFENARVVQLANPPAESHPPEPSFQRPQPPPLPMPEPQKKKP
jgi:hypothetical protein